jgi:glycosyltransferase involved in cell wall biosynthesis
LRVLHIIESLEFGGAEKVAVSLANGLAGSYDTSICCVKRIGALSAEIDPRISVFCLNKSEGNDYLLPFRLAYILARGRFDVAHTHSWSVFLEGGLAGALARTRVMVHTVHGPYAAYPPSIGSRLKLSLRHFLERLVSRRFDRIVTVSNAIRSYVETAIRIPSNRLLTVHNGISANARPPHRPEREIITFMTVGRLSPIKNHAMMLRAFHRLAELRPHVRLVIVGDGPERSTLEDDIKRLDLEDKVSLPGFRPKIDLLLAEADVFMLTSRYEGISIALLEAMRSGLPAIGTSVGGIPETIVEGITGFLIAPDDDEALAGAMRRLADSRLLRETMGKRGYDHFLSDFTLQIMLSRYQQLYGK